MCSISVNESDYKRLKKCEYIPYAGDDSITGKYEVVLFLFVRL